MKIKIIIIHIIKIKKQRIKGVVKAKIKTMFQIVHYLVNMQML